MVADDVVAAVGAVVAAVAAVGEREWGDEEGAQRKG